MNQLTRQAIDIVKAEFKRRIRQESLGRIETCLNVLSDNEIWYRHNENTNSLGNLVLHLDGNIRQYIISGVGGAPDDRNRAQEFSWEKPLERQELLHKIAQTIDEAITVVESLESERLSEQIRVQGFDESILSVLIHVIEHTSYHTGQITFYTKFVKNIDTGYYQGKDLDVTGRD